MSSEMGTTKRPTNRVYTRHGINREEWRAVYSVTNGRAKGTLYDGLRMARPSFSVAIKEGRFSVDIGTGSGVKIVFEHW